MFSGTNDAVKRAWPFRYRFQIYLILTVLLSMIYGGVLNAAVYRYVDVHGRKHFSNVPVTPEFTFYCAEKGDAAPAKKHLSALIGHYSRVYGIDPALVKAVVKAESNFDARCVSDAGAIGLMQVMPETAAEMLIEDPFDPAQNIAAGSRYLSRMLKRFDGNLDFALAAYNAGPSVVERFGGVPPYRETQEYLRNVKNYIREFSRKNYER